MSRARPYLRPAEPLWWAHPPYLAYTLREATGLAVAGYAVVLLAGLIGLASGESAYAAWLNFLKSPWSLALHLLFLTGRRVLPQRWITSDGIAVAMASMIIVLLVAVWMQP